MEANKSESEKCIQVALRAVRANDYEKALKFLNKAKQLYPSPQIDGNHFSISSYWFLYLT